MPTFTIDGFAHSCKQAMSGSKSPAIAAARLLEQTIADCSTEEIIAVLDQAIPAGASVGEMIVHLSPELTMLYARIPPRFQSGIHNHTVFACIGQLVGEEQNVFYERDAEHGLRETGRRTLRTGEVLKLGSDLIHSIENPGLQTASALHLYGGDFQALMEHRSLWSSTNFQENPFSFEALLRESAIAMHRDENSAGLEHLCEAIPAARTFVDELT